MKKRNMRILTLVLAIFMVLPLIAACGNGDDATPATPGDTTPTAPPATTPAAPPGGGQGDIAFEAPPEDARLAEEIRVIIDNNVIGVLNPFSPAANNPPTNWVFTMIYDRLLDIDDDGNILPELATAHHTDDYQTFRFTLREDVYFHNGDKFTSADVYWTIHAARTYGMGSAAFDQWGPIRDINILGDYEIEFVLNEVNVDFLFGLTRPMAGIVNENAMRANAETGTFIGTGAFSVINFLTGDYVFMQRHDNWWNTEMMPPTARMHLRFVPEMGTRAIMLQNREVNISFGTSAEDIPLFENDPDNWTVQPLIFNDPQGINFNMNDPITGDRNFRMAVLHALDRVEVATVAAGVWADGDLQDGNFWGFTTELRAPGIPFIAQDLDRAREYLEASVYNGEVVEIATAIVTNIRAAEVVQAQLADVGINTVINVMDTPSLLAYVTYGNTQSQINIIFTQLSPNAGSIRHAFYPGAAQNRSNFNNPQVTALIDEAAVTFDQARRRAIYYEIQEIIAYYQPVSNLLWRINGIVFENSVGGMILRSDLHRIDLRYMFMVLDD